MKKAKKPVTDWRNEMRNYAKPAPTRIYPVITRPMTRADYVRFEELVTLSRKRGKTPRPKYALSCRQK